MQHNAGFPTSSLKTLKVAHADIHTKKRTGALFVHSSNHMLINEAGL
jgi:hypothetical protein